jgi:hypothetical protein
VAASSAKRSRWLGCRADIARRSSCRRSRSAHRRSETAGDDQRLSDIGDLHRHVHREGLVDFDLRAFVDDRLELAF